MLEDQRKTSFSGSRSSANGDRKRLQNEKSNNLLSIKSIA